METWEWMLFAAVGFLAVVSLVRLMMRRRDSLVEELNVQAEADKKRQKKKKKSA